MRDGTYRCPFRERACDPWFGYKVGCPGCGCYSPVGQQRLEDVRGENKSLAASEQDKQIQSCGQKRQYPRLWLLLLYSPKLNPTHPQFSVWSCCSPISLVAHHPRPAPRVLPGIHSPRSHIYKSANSDHSMKFNIASKKFRRISTLTFIIHLPNRPRNRRPKNSSTSTKKSDCTSPFPPPRSFPVSQPPSHSRIFYDKKISQEVPGDSLGDEWKGYIFRITGG